MSLLSPSSSLWAARQLGEALVRPPAQAPQLAGLPGITRKAHTTLSAHRHAGVHLDFSWELEKDPCLSSRLVWVYILMLLEGAEEGRAGMPGPVCAVRAGGHGGPIWDRLSLRAAAQWSLSCGATGAGVRC